MIFNFQSSCLWPSCEMQVENPSVQISGRRRDARFNHDSTHLPKYLSISSPPTSLQCLGFFLLAFLQKEASWTMLLRASLWGFKRFFFLNEGNDYSIGWGLRPVTGYVRVKSDDSGRCRMPHSVRTIRETGLFDNRRSLRRTRSFS